MYRDGRALSERELFQHRPAAVVPQDEQQRTTSGMHSRNPYMWAAPAHAEDRHNH